MKKLIISLFIIFVFIQPVSALTEGSEEKDIWVVQSDSLNVRPEASINKNSISTLHKGDTVKLEKKVSNFWCKINYIQSSYLKKDDTNEKYVACKYLTKLSADNKILFNHYRNKELGFSMNIPKKATALSNVCPSGYHVPLITLIDRKNSEVYIVPSYHYRVDNNKICKKIKSSIASVTGGFQVPTYIANPTGISVNPNWKIAIKNNIKNDQDLEQIIKKEYGEGCSIGEKKTTAQAGIWDINIASDGKDPEESKCFVNYAYKILYSPEKEKVAYWNLGQEPVFYPADPGKRDTASYDNAMVNSFRFDQ